MINVTEVIWTDGPSSEFKNRYMAYFLQVLSKRYNKPFCWKYSATSHGKGVVHGIDGRAKSIVRAAVMSRSEKAPIVQTAKDFSEQAAQLKPTTTVIYIGDQDIKRDDQYWENASPLAGIKNFHVLKAFPNGDLHLFYSAVHPVQETFCVKNASSSKMIGDWVLVRYDDDIFPGEITQIAANEYEVRVMVKAAGSTWKWPRKEDKVWYNMENVVKQISPPDVAGSRGQFVFRDKLHA